MDYLIRVQKNNKETAFKISEEDFDSIKPSALGSLLSKAVKALKK